MGAQVGSQSQHLKGVTINWEISSFLHIDHHLEHEPVTLLWTNQGLLSVTDDAFQPWRPPSIFANLKSLELNRPFGLSHNKFVNSMIVAINY